MKLKKQDNKEIESIKKDLEEYTDTLKRLQADFENYIKRTENEKQEFAKYSTHKLLSKLLTIVDDFEKAIRAIEHTKDINELKKGLEILFSNLMKTLKEEGIKEIESIGKKADPYHHEIIAFTEGEEDGIILDEIQKGYKLHDKVLRPAKVRVSKKKEMKEKDQESNLEENKNGN